MRALVLGCGEMGTEAIRDIYRFGDFSEITVCTRNPDAARTKLKWLAVLKKKLSFERLVISEGSRLDEIFRGYDIVVNCAGPNYKYEVCVARAAIRARVDLVDINDDYETTYEMLTLDNEARAAGITIILGLGASPGINNILARAAADDLDDVEEIHTAWVMSAADPGGLALSYHLIHSLSGKAQTYVDGRMVQVESFRDGKERVDFPSPVGRVDVYHVGHPEPITLSRSFPNARLIDDKASFLPSHINDEIRRLGEIARNQGEPIELEGRCLDPEDYAAEELYRICRQAGRVSRDGALRTEVTGAKNGRRMKIAYSSSGRLTFGTGIPASIGAQMLAKKEIRQKGVLPPEECINANRFLEEILSRGIGDLDIEKKNL